MKKSIVYIIFTLSVCILSIIGYIVYNGEYSKTAIVGKENVQNIQKVQTGMDSISVLTIMGQPSERYVYNEEIFYNYEVPPGLSFQCQIILNKRGKVTFKSGAPNLTED